MRDAESVGSSEKEKSRAFYSAVLKVIGIEMQVDEGQFVAFGPKGRHILWLNQSDKGRVTQRVHLAFSAESRNLVEEF
jgi:hypothetical protein